MDERTSKNADASLTPREGEVLELLRLGLTNAEIADRLGISLAGARYHVSEIIGKLGVRDRYEAASWRPEKRAKSAFAMPLALLGRNMNLGWMSWVVGGVAIAGMTAGLALLAWGIVLTDGDADSDLLVPDVGVRPTSTIVIVQVSFPTPDATTLASIPTPLPTPIDPSVCAETPQTGLPRYYGALERADFSSLELQTDAVGLIVTGTVRQREIMVVQLWSQQDFIVIDEPVINRPLPVLTCTAQYVIEVTEVLKNTEHDDVGDELTLRVYEREVYLDDLVTIEVVPALAPGDEVILFLQGDGFPNLGFGSYYSVFGPRLVIEAEGLRPAGEFRRYAAELEGITADEVLAQIRARAALVPDVLPFMEVIERMTQ